MNTDISISSESIAYKIYFIRGQKVMIDRDLAVFYGVQTGRLNEQVKRNIERFPVDFMFQLDSNEYGVLISQNATSKTGRGGYRKLPYAFTEHGVVMLASVLKSEKAVSVSIAVVRTFIRIREILSSNKELAYKIQEFEREQKLQNRHINTIYSMLDKLLNEPIMPRKPIGFRGPNE